MAYPYDTNHRPIIPGFLAYTVCVAASIVITAIYRFVCARENKRRDALGEEARVE